MNTAALIFITVLILLSIFQLTLIFGAPFGRFAWGGQHNVLPNKLRIGSVFSILIYVVFAVFVVSKSGLWIIIPKGILLDIGVWVIFGYSAIGIFMNAVSRSKAERNLMTPTALILALCALALALG